MKKIILFAIFLVAIIIGCQKESEESIIPVDGFDRGAILENWADNIIIPAHKAYNATTITLYNHAETFSNAPTLVNLEALRIAWFESYKAWQNVPFFIDEKGDDPNILISLFTNHYPVKPSLLHQYVDEENYDFTQSSNKPVQGFPALDYMLYGLADTDDGILSFYTTNGIAEKYRRYLVDLTNRIKIQSTVVYEDWGDGYRDKFVANTGKSSMASVNKVVNDFIYSYEFDLRTSKVGFPSGACVGCDGTINKSYIEARYRGDISKILLLEALNAAQDFYNGVPFKGSFEDRGTSLYQYLDYLDARKDGEKLNDLINTQFDKARVAIEKLSDDFADELENRNELMIEVHTHLQLNVLYLKTYMMNSIKIGQDYGTVG